MTKKLFIKNTYIKEFNANIIKLFEENNEFHLLLDQTAFFPEGGGQPCDLGFIDEIPVKYVYEEDDSIYHVVGNLPNKLENLKCILDWNRRFDHMQQHLGQHILSSAFETLCDAETIGFHLGAEYVTIDLNQPLKEGDISSVEYFANQIIFNDLVVETLYPTPEELSVLPLRKKTSVKENIRIVKIDDFDYSACCGTHPNRTGEVGLIKIRKWENYKEGIRIEFVCGNRALKDYFYKNNITNIASSILSVKDVDIINSIERINEELIVVKKENKNLKEKLMEYESKDLINSSNRIKDITIISNLYRGRDFGELRQLSSIITNMSKSIVIFGNIIDDKAQLIISRSKGINNINIKAIFDEVIQIIDGKGGGNQFTAQGGGKNSEKINTVIEKSYNLLINGL